MTRNMSEETDGTEDYNLLARREAAIDARHEAAPVEPDDNTYTIPVTAWPDFVAKILKLNKRAAKLGCDPITYNVIATTEVTRSHTFKSYDGEHTRHYKVAAKVIELHGTAPKLEGWQFVAKIEYLSDGKSMLFHQVPGADIKIDERFRKLTPATCEHCHKVRRRNDCFVVLKVETGVQTQVGRQCLADFTGINTPEKIAAKASWLSSFSDLREECERWFGGHFAKVLDTQHVLSLTSAYIAEIGWIPRSAMQPTSTATMVSEHFWGMPKDKDSDRARYMNKMAALAEEPVHQDRARQTVEWIKTDLAKRAKSDYEMNLVTLVAGELCEQKHLGIVCSAVAAFQRAMNQQVEYAKKKEARADSKYVGEVGKRFKGMAVKVEFVKAVEASAWGARTLVKFADDAGNLMTWFASGDRDYHPGASVKIDGTVKKHEDYRGVKQTMLTRVVVHYEEAAK